MADSTSSMSATPSGSPGTPCSSQTLSSISSQRREPCSAKKCFQVVTAICLFLLMSLSLVANRLSLSWIFVLREARPNQLVTWYAAMGLLLIVPEIVSLVKVFWHTSFIKRTTTHKWPGGMAMFVGLLVSFAEATSYVVFSLEVAPWLPVQIMLPLLGGVFAISLSHQQWISYKADMARSSSLHFDNNFTLKDQNDIPKNSNNHRKTRHCNNWKHIAQAMLASSGIWASCAISGILAMTSSLPWYQAICLPASISILSLCWHPKVQVYIIKSPGGTYMGRWKATCVYTIIKIIVIILGLNIVMLLRLENHGVLDTQFFSSLWTGIKSCKQADILYPLLCHFASSLSVHILGYATAGLCITGVALTIPYILATPGSVAVILYLCSPLGVQPFALMPCIDVSTGVWCACVMAVLTWLAPIAIGHRHLHKNADKLLMPFDEIFIQPGWNGLFLEQHLTLNYRPEGFNPHEHDDEKNPRTRVFICTTMYREADFEMSRLLSSLVKVSKSQKLSNIYMEAHIFMDNGAKDKHITDFASQLISLLEDKVGVTVKEADSYITPYGVQLNWILPGGMPFFIHLKDGFKVKARKRWSQVMYMSYVLNFRVLKDRHQKPTAVIETGQQDYGVTIDDSICLGYASEREWLKNTVRLSSEKEIKISPNFSRVTNTLDSRTRLYLRESKRKLAMMVKESPFFINFQKIDNAESIISCIRAPSIEAAVQTSSSDTGLGTSDDVASLSSSNERPDDLDSSEAPASRQSSVNKDSDEVWQDYEGDVSSNNESSLTSARARFLSERAHEYFSNDTEIPYENFSNPFPYGKHGYYNVPYHPSHYYPRFNKSLERRPRRPGHPVKPSRPLRQRREYFQNKIPISRTNGSPRGAPLRRIDTPTGRKSSSGHNSPKYISHGSSTNLAGVNDEEADTPYCYENHCFEPNETIITNNQEACNAVEVVNQEQASISIADSQDGSVIPLRTVPSADTILKLDESVIDDHTYILATDADMEFSDDSVMDLLNLCHYDRRVGGACGRTHPIGQKTGPLVWYQKFEYAKDFWMIKSAQNVIGSVMCCPGCFSLYRAGAIRDVLNSYASPTLSSFDVFTKDTGEDRWMCTLMMLEGWKLEYTAFCDNTTYCPDNFNEFIKQRRRWVLSDLANMLLVFRNVFTLMRKNNSFSIAYILYLAQMFSIVLLSPASTVVIMAGGLEIVYGIPYALIAPILGVLILTYALICIVGSLRTQARLSLILTMLLSLVMLLVVVGGAVFVVQDISTDIQRGTLSFQEYYLILLLIATLVFAAFVHPLETWIVSHGMSYLLGFPAMQILLPIYSICNIVDQSWGTRETNESKAPPVSCFAKNRKRYHNSLSRASTLPDEVPEQVCPPEDEKPVTCTDQFQSMDDAKLSDELTFWSNLRDIVLGHDKNLGLQGERLNSGLRTLRNICLLSLLLVNTLWLVLLSVLYYNADLNLAKLNIYGLIAGAVYGLVLFIQLVGMVVHRIQATFTRFARAVFGGTRPAWVNHRVTS